MLTTNNKQLSIIRKGRFYWLKLKRIKGDPFSLARGLALGAFVGVTPTIPFHTVLILLLGAALRANLLAATIFSILISNPLTVPIFYYLSWWIGSRLTGSEIGWAQVKNIITTLKTAGIMDSVSMLYQTGSELIIALLTGGIIIAIPPAIAAYYASLYLSYKKDKRKAKNYLDYALWHKPSLGK